MKAIRLRTEYMGNPIGIDIRRPYLSWNCSDGKKQTAYEVEAVCGNQVIWDSGKVADDRMNALLGVETGSRQRVSWRVRLWDEEDRAGDWSEEAFFEMGLLEREEFMAKWIDPEPDEASGVGPAADPETASEALQKAEPQPHKPASYLRKSFYLEEKGVARLYITCHGLYEAYLNGKRVGDFVLAPGTSTYDKRLFYQTYDVTELLAEGENHVRVILGDGWYRSCSSVDGDRNLYGEDVALYFQLEVDGRAVCVSDESWEASQNGPIRENDMQQGEVVDARLEEIGGYHEVKLAEFGVENLSCSNCVPIVEAERFAGKIIKTPNGETVIDYGQNLAGYVEFTVNVHAGDRIVLTHGESLDENGNFTAENFQDRKRHKEGGTRQQVVYICKEGENHYKSRFTIWGFRYAKVETDVDLSDAAFTSIAVYSRMEQLGRFECSDEAVNKLVENSIWSQKSNFCDVPTDCPTRERAAWTGDMGVFAQTGIYLEDCYPVIRKWLGECRLNQYEDGKVANIAPRNNNPSFFTKLLAGSVGWGDACIIVPYVLYKRYGDARILEENYDMMRRWFGYLESRAGKKEQQGGMDYAIETGVDYGEWCEPDVESTSAMGKPQGKVATAYFARSGQMLAEIAGILGKKEDAVRYKEICEKAKGAFRHLATKNGRIHSDRQAEYVRAISFDLLDKEEKRQAAADLNELVVKNDYHLNTGFLSTPFLCGVLAEYGYVETAYKLLLQDTMPSWLYAVKKGATTIWETWDGRASLNHYSYGAICGWLFSGVCGIRLEQGHIVIRPTPHKSLQYAKASYLSPLGEIVSGWRYEGEEPVYEIDIPAGAQADVILPDGRRERLAAGRYCL